MKVFNHVKDCREYLKNEKRAGKTIGFVPTMGALHEGHLSLLRRAKKENDVVVLSIFVNPIQFGANEDFDKYPRNGKKDIELAETTEVDVVFLPETLEIYPEYPADQTVFVDVFGVSEGLCGGTRPGHFRGVATVVAKLFNIVMPDNVYLGQKDYQQCLVLKNMVSGLNYDVNIVMCPIVREDDGLAMSSRNRYLSQDERKEAVCLIEALLEAKYMIQTEKIIDVEKIMDKIRQRIENRKNKYSKIDYIFIGDASTLKLITEIKVEESTKIVIALAVYVGKTRLIDNVLV